MLVMKLKKIIKKLFVAFFISHFYKWGVSMLTLYHEHTDRRKERQTDAGKNTRLKIMIMYFKPESIIISKKIQWKHHECTEYPVSISKDSNT